MVEGGRHLVSEPCPGSAWGPTPLACGRGLPPLSCRELACRAVVVGGGQQARLRAEAHPPQQREHVEPCAHHLGSPLPSLERWHLRQTCPNTIRSDSGPFALGQNQIIPWTRLA